jgi:histidinol dehydrogenase
MRIIGGAEFDAYWKALPARTGDDEADRTAGQVIAAVRAEGDAAVRRFAARFDRASPEIFEAPPKAVEAAWEKLKTASPDLTAALELAASHIGVFAEKQKAQFSGFEYEMAPGLFTGQRVIPVERAAVYVPAGRFPLISSVLMGAIPAFAAGVREVLVVSPPLEDGLPDWRIMAAARLAGKAGKAAGSSLRVFAMGGAQAIAALALGTGQVPRADLIAGPGNRYVAAAKRLLFGEVGIDFIAGPTDVLIIADGSSGSGVSGENGLSGEEKPDCTAISAADMAAADMLAQAEHDPDARARVLVPRRDLADHIAAALERRLAALPTAPTAGASLDAGGLIVVYHSREEAVGIANTIAPEHLELQVADPERWIPALVNFGSLFIGNMAAEVLGDYSAGINHTLPTSTGARFSGGLSVRSFLKTVTTLRCTPGRGYHEALDAAERIARAEGLAGHAESALSRK